MASDLITPYTPTSSVDDRIARMGDAIYEVVNGEVLEKDVSAYAVWIATRLYDLLKQPVARQQLGLLFLEMGFVLDPARGLRRRPDLAFLSANRWPIDRVPPMEGDWPAVPDLAVEVISPSNGFEEMVAKADEYLENGVREVWLIAPRTPYIYLHRGPSSVLVLTADERLESPLFPGWSALVSDVIPPAAT